MIAEQLKKAVLQAAIQGKLTEQLSEDGNARDLLKDIQKEKARLVKEGKLKKEKPLPEITEDEIPFDIPENWCWTRFSLVSTMISSKSHQIFEKEIKSEGLFPVVSQGKKLIEGYSDKNERLLVHDEPIIVFGDHTKNLKIINFNFIVGADGTKLIQAFKINPEYLYRILQLNVIRISTRNYGRHFNLLVSELIALPPLVEQQRIVEILDQVLTEIDNLALDENKLDKLEKAFPKKMKDAILQAAIQGKLTEQLSEDGDARDLLKDIQKEKARLVKEGKLKKEKPLPEITEDEIPFDIPENWVWVRLGDIGIWAAGATPLKSNPKYYIDGKIPWLKTGDLNDSIIYSVPDYITDLALKNTSLKLQPIGAVLIAMYGATIGKVGILGIEATTNQACCACNTFIGVYNYFLFYFLKSHKQQFIDQGAGGAQPNISREKIINNLIPLPPLAEQQRIVEKLDQVLPLLDRLE